VIIGSFYVPVEFLGGPYGFSCRGVWYPCPPSNLGVSPCLSLMFFANWSIAGLVIQSSLNDVLVQPLHHAHLPPFEGLHAWHEGGTFHLTTCVIELSSPILFDNFLYLQCYLYGAVSYLINSNNFFSVVPIGCQNFSLCAIYMVTISFSGAGKGIASPVMFYDVIFVIVG